MLDLAGWARVFLVVAGTAFLLAYGLPLLFAPRRWARVFRWDVPEDDGLCVYFGRCLGGVAVALVAGCMVAATDPPRNSIIFLTIAIACALMTAVHAWGAITGEQPWPEHLEIPMYAALAAISAWFYAAL